MNAELGAAIQPVPLLFCLAAVVVSAFWGGLGPGLLATCAGAWISYFLLAPPPEAAAPDRLDGMLRLGFFVLLSLLICWMGGNLRTAQQRLAESERLFESFMRHCPATAFVKDQDGRYVYANELFQQSFRLERDSCLGKTDYELWPVEAARRIRESDEKVLVTGKACEVLEPVQDGGEESSWLTLRFPFEDTTGEILLAGMAVNVTQRKRLEDELRQRLEELAEEDRCKDAFLMMLAHELRNPLAAIANASYVLQQTRLQDPKTERLRDTIRHQAQHLTRLVDDLLDIARVRKGKLSLRLRHVDLRSVVRAAAEGTLPLIQMRQHQLDIRLPPEPLLVEADPDRLEQVVRNLLHNAAKYMERGGRIDLCVERERAEAVIRVRDTGIGIDPQSLKMIFEPFRQAGNAGSHSESGMGIGLALARSLVEAHRGTISAVSEGPGRGSEFLVRLPIVLGSNEALPGKESAVTELAAHSSRKILVVDDNESAAETLADLLGLQGHQVRIASSGHEALEAAPGFKPDVVLLDISMPGMTGYEVARHLRRLPFGRELRLLAMTGYGEEAAGQSYEAGFDHHLVKPLDPDELLQLLQDP